MELGEDYGRCHDSIKLPASLSARRKSENSRLSGRRRKDLSFNSQNFVKVGIIRQAGGFR